MIHRRRELRASKIMQERALAHPKVTFAWNAVVREVLDVEQNTVTGVRLQDTVTGQERVLPCQGLFIAIGHTPNTSIFKDWLKFDDLDYVVTGAELWKQASLAYTLQVMSKITCGGKPSLLQAPAAWLRLRQSAGSVSKVCFNVN